MIDPVAASLGLGARHSSTKLKSKDLLMNVETRYTVHPLDTTPITSSEEPNRTEGWGDLISKSIGISYFGVIAVGVLLSSLWPEVNQRALVVLLAIIGLVGSIIIMIRTLNSRYSQRLEALKIQKIREAQDEATRAESMATTALEKARQAMRALNVHLEKASRNIQQAKYEYSHNAYAPFWDAVERAACDLGLYWHALRELKTNADSYYNLLATRTHTFPSLEIDQRLLTEPSPVVQALKTLLRTGQTNFQFAIIWEQRQTREILIAGFQTLGDALANLEGVIFTSVQNLEITLSSGVAQILEEQVRARRATRGREI